VIEKYCKCNGTRHVIENDVNQSKLFCEPGIMFGKATAGNFADRIDLPGVETEVDAAKSHDDPASPPIKTSMWTGKRLSTKP
jgi:hypothetical protein